ncbi:MAG TPA: nuclear transport factor 2 family protein [Phototrophicaceae bacterium]|nr:nuclear transport factor 2 family protein [Phototrophicaceae bacterium]
MSLEQNIQTVRSLYDYFNQKDMAGLMSIVSDDFVLNDIALGMTWRGKQGWGEWLGIWAVSLPDAQVHVDSVTGQGNFVVAEHTGGGTQTGPLNTPSGVIPPTGKQINLSFAEFFEMRDGKIAVMRAYWDTGTLMRQLGVA